jgi:predicted PurR-regulated permease PerM/nucleotide-binding universal stress UspA family protein
MPDSLPPPELPATSSEATPAAVLTRISMQITIVVAVVIVTALYLGREVLIPITIALLLTFLLSPLVERLRDLRLGRIPSVILAVLLALAIIGGIGSAIGTQVAQLAHELPEYQVTIEKKIATVRDTTLTRLNDRIDGISHQLFGPPANRPAPQPVQTAPAASEQAPAQKPVPVVVTQPQSSVLEIGKQVISPLINPLATAGIIFVVTIFALLQKEDLRDRAIRLLGSHDLQRSTLALNDAGHRLSRYFLTQLGLNASFGVIIGAGLYLIGVPHPVLWGILGALLRFIPYIGSWIAALLPVTLAAAVEPGWTMAIATAALYGVVELVMGQLIEPLVYGHSTGLSPLAVVIAAIFWTWVWGPIGLIISTPLTLCLVVLGRHVPNLEFLDAMLGDRPVLSPEASFYQRMLADDPDEAEEQAERYLAESPLLSYYDEVVLKGLQLAAGDIARGALNPAQVARLRTSTMQLVGGLADYSDPPAGDGDDSSISEQPVAPVWQGPGSVLCVAGRGVLDEAAAAMLAQLLHKRGIGARALPYAAVSRSQLASLDVRSAKMICISYLDISGNPTHLRYLIRRLRVRLADVPILIGLWPAGDAILQDRDLRQAVGADYYVSTLREAVEDCIAMARHGAPGFVANIERLLVAVDASPSGQFASRLVGLLAGARHIPTTVIHFDYEQQTAPQLGAEQARRTETVIEESADAGDEAGPSEPGEDPVEITTKIEKPDEGAIQAEASNGYDFLLIGREPASEGPRIHDQILRSAAAFNGPFGIAIARGPDRAEGPSRPLNILVPVTEMAFSRRGAETAVALAQASQGTVTALHVAAARPAPHSPRHQVGAAIAPNGSSEAVIRDIVQLGETYGVEVRNQVHHDGAASSEILRQMRTGNHDLLVMGVSPSRGEGLFFGDVPAELLSRCDGSILFVSEPLGSVGESRESKDAVLGGIDNATERRLPVMPNTSPRISVPGHTEN